MGLSKLIVHHVFVTELLFRRRNTMVTTSRVLREHIEGARSTDLHGAIDALTPMTLAEDTDEVTATFPPSPLITEPTPVQSCHDVFF